MREMQVQSLGQEDLLEKETATHSSIFVWAIPWIEEPGRLQSTGSQRVRHEWALTHTVILYCDTKKVDWDLTLLRNYYAWDIFLVHKDSFFWCPGLSPEKADMSLQNTHPLALSPSCRTGPLGNQSWTGSIRFFSVGSQNFPSGVSWVGVLAEYRWHWYLRGSLCCLVPEVARAAFLSSLLKFYLFIFFLEFSYILSMNSFSWFPQRWFLLSATKRNFNASEVQLDDSKNQCS